MTTERFESSAARQEDSGHGLHLSQKLAALLGGYIEFESEYGKGSQFALRLAGRQEAYMRVPKKREHPHGDSL